MREGKPIPASETSCDESLLLPETSQGKSLCQCPECPFPMPRTYEKRAYLEHKVCKCLIFQHLYTNGNCVNCVRILPKSAQE